MIRYRLDFIISLLFCSHIYSAAAEIKPENYLQKKIVLKSIDRKLELAYNNQFTFFTKNFKDKDIDFRDLKGSSRLDYAVRANKVELVKLLIEYDANLALGGNFDETALHIAAFNSSCESAEALLRGGANRYLLDVRGDTPLDIAVRLYEFYKEEYLLGVIREEYLQRYADFLKIIIPI